MSANLDYIYATILIIILDNRLILDFFKKQIDVSLYIMTLVLVILLIEYLVRFFLNII